MPFFRRRYRDLSVYVSVYGDGHRSISIHGGNPAEVGALMHEVLDRTDRATVAITAERN